MPLWALVAVGCFLGWIISACLIGSPGREGSYYNFPNFANILLHAGNTIFWLAACTAAIVTLFVMRD